MDDNSTIPTGGPEEAQAVTGQDAPADVIASGDASGMSPCLSLSQYICQHSQSCNQDRNRARNPLKRKLRSLLELITR